MSDLEADGGVTTPQPGEDAALQSTGDGDSDYDEAFADRQLQMAFDAERTTDTDEPSTSGTSEAGSSEE